MTTSLLVSVAAAQPSLYPLVTLVRLAHSPMDMDLPMEDSLARMDSLERSLVPSLAPTLAMVAEAVMVVTDVMDVMTVATAALAAETVATAALTASE